MLEFSKKIMITGAEQRVKKSDGSTYIIVHCMGDNGQTFGSMFKGDTNKIMQIEKMKEYDVKFAINVGQYTHLSILDINK